MEADAAIIWSVLWSGRMIGNRLVYEHYRRSGRPVIVVDVGTLIRGITWKIGLDNVNGLGWFGDQPVDPNRPSRFGLQIQKQSHGHAVLIATQHRQSLQAQHIQDMERWVLDQISLARLHTDRPIVLRPHPRDPLRLPTLPHGVSLEVPRKIPGTYDDFDWKNHWHAVINHNSGPGVLAAIAGARPVVHASSLAWPVAVNMSDVEKIYDRDRQDWLVDVSHTEYTIEEIKQGEWLKRLRSRL